MSGPAFVVEAHYPLGSLRGSEWVEVCGSRAYCQGFIDARREVLHPRPAAEAKRARRRSRRVKRTRDGWVDHREYFEGGT